MEHYVLQDFAKSEWPWVEALCEIVAENAALLIEGKDSTFQNKSASRHGRQRLRRRRRAARLE